MLWIEFWHDNCCMSFWSCWSIFVDRERILGYRDESQRLDQCNRLYDSSVSNDGFELDASHIVQVYSSIWSNFFSSLFIELGLIGLNIFYIVYICVLSNNSLLLGVIVFLGKGFAIAYIKFQTTQNWTSHVNP